MSIAASDIRLRAIEPEDLEWLYRWENEARLWPFGSTRQPYSRFTLKHYIETALETDIQELRQLRLMIDCDGRTVGSVDLYDYDAAAQRAGISILVEPEWQQRKIGTLSLNLMEEYARQTLLLHQLYAEIAEDNLPSITLFEKSGFQFRGKMQDWLRDTRGYHGILLYQKML